MSSVTSLFGAVVGPKYDGKYLRSLANGLLDNLTVKQTLTDVIIPTFDIKRAAVVHEYADLFLAMVMLHFGKKKLQIRIHLTRFIMSKKRLTNSMLIPLLSLEKKGWK